MAAFPFVQSWIEHLPDEPTAWAPVAESVDAAVTTDAALNDAGLVDEPVVDASVELDSRIDEPDIVTPRCSPIRRRVFDFHTTSDDSPVRHGCYVLTVVSQEQCAVNYRLERRGYGNRPDCETRSYAQLASGVARVDQEQRLAVTGTLNGRTYTFDFLIADGRLTGGFGVDARTGSYRGEIADDRVP